VGAHTGEGLKTAAVAYFSHPRARSLVGWRMRSLAHRSSVLVSVQRRKREERDMSARVHWASSWPILFIRELWTTIQSGWAIVVVRANARPRSSPFYWLSWVTPFTAQAQEGVWCMRKRHTWVCHGPVMFFGLFKQWTVEYFSFLISADVRETQQGKSWPRLWTDLGCGSAAAWDGLWANFLFGLILSYE
jgi:hypothetical protein